MTTVNLRDRLFNDTGGIVQNATVQAILVTGGGTDVGTSSAVQSTTTTDVNGMWKFVNLPDPGAGNWYDVKITNGNQVRWRYGNIQAAIQQALLNANVSVTGSLTVGNGATVTTGNLGVNTAAVSNYAEILSGTINASGAAAVGVGVNSTLVAQANNDNLYGLLVNPTFNDNGKTGVVHNGLVVQSGVVTIGQSVAQIVPGPTSLSLRNNANTQDNLILTDAGAATFRSTVSGITTLTATTLAGMLSTGAQTNVTSVGTLTGLTLSDAGLITTPSTYLRIGPAADLYLRPGSGTTHIGDSPISDVVTGRDVTVGRNLVVTGSATSPPWPLAEAEAAMGSDTGLGTNTNTSLASVSLPAGIYLVFGSASLTSTGGTLTLFAEDDTTGGGTIITNSGASSVVRTTDTIELSFVAKYTVPTSNCTISLRGRGSGGGTALHTDGTGQGLNTTYIKAVRIG